MTMLPAFVRRLGTALPLAAALFALAPAAAQAQSGAAPGPHNVLNEITDVVGLKPRFELRATDQVENAAAVNYNGQRFLLYNPDFVAAVNQAGRTDWAGISILAHEMGHHLNGHTLRPGGSNPADELEADEFSGFVLRKMGASLAQAQAGMAVVSDEEASPTHPGRDTRLRAIGDGWQRASQQIAASNRAATPSAAPAVVPVAAPQPPAAPDTSGYIKYKVSAAELRGTKAVGPDKQGNPSEGRNNALRISISGVNPGDQPIDCSSEWFHPDTETSTYVPGIKCSDPGLEVNVQEFRKPTPYTSAIDLFIIYT